MYPSTSKSSVYKAPKIFPCENEIEKYKECQEWQECEKFQLSRTAKWRLVYCFNDCSRLDARILAPFMELKRAANERSKWKCIVYLCY